MKITKEMSEASYDYAQKVYNGLIERNDALDHLEKDLGMNRNSAADHINNFKYMIEGKSYARTNNEYTTDYFLGRIYSDYGRDKLGAALSAVSAHLEYYEALRRTTLHGIRKVYEKHRTIFNTSDSTLYPDELPTSGRLL